MNLDEMMEQASNYRQEMEEAEKEIKEEQFLAYHEDHNVEILQGINPESGNSVMLFCYDCNIPVIEIVDPRHSQEYQNSLYYSNLTEHVEHSVEIINEDTLWCTDCEKEVECEQTIKYLDD